MENFTNKNARRNRPQSLDGISSRGSQKPSGSIGFSRPISRPTPQASPRRIDDFKKPDGLRPTQTSSVLHDIKRSSSATPSAEVAKSGRFKKNPFARKKKEHRPKLDGVSRIDKKAQRKRRMKIAGASCAAILLLGIFGYGYLKNIFSGGGGAAALQENVDPSKLRGEGDGRVNVLLMGRAGEGGEAPDLTDTMIVVSIDPINNEAGIVSIPRDLYVTVPDAGSMKINQVFYTGKNQILNSSPEINDDVKKRATENGYNLAKSTVEEVLGIPIHYRGMVDFTGFKKAIDTVGGLDVKVPKTVQEHMLIDGRPYYLNVKKGEKHFEGHEALAYARSRYTSEKGDFDRSERQRLMIVALKDKILSADTFTNPAKIAQLLDNFGSHVQTDFSLSDIARLKEIFQQIDSSKISSIDLVNPPNDYLTTTMLGGLSVVLPKSGADDYEAIHSYIRNTLRDGYLKNENANVMILNGTNRVGLATEKANELKSYGYNIGTIDNAPNGRSYSRTVLIDLTHGQKKYTKRYLEQRFGTIAVESPPDNSIQSNSAEFIVILGSDIR